MKSIFKKLLFLSILLCVYTSCIQHRSSSSNATRNDRGSGEPETPNNPVVEDARENINLLESSVSPIVTAYHHSCFLDNSGRAKCWGSNKYGELGLEDENNRGDEENEMEDNLPFINLGEESIIKSIAIGFSNACAILGKGRLKCWGSNRYPSDHGLIATGVLGISMNTDDGRDERADKSIIGDQRGEMGDNLPYINLGTEVKDIAVGGNHFCAILSTDKLKCWGDRPGPGVYEKYYSSSGELRFRANPRVAPSTSLSNVNLGTARTVKAIALGGGHSCAILDNDKLKCWGSNNNGLLGIGDTDNRGDDLDEMGDNLPYIELGNRRTVKAIFTGDSHSCAILDNDKLKCWGGNGTGGLGLGDTNHRGDGKDEMGRNLPYVKLGTGRTVKAVALGGGHSCAILDDNRLKCWGANNHGQLGYGNTEILGDEEGEMGNNLPYVDLGTGRTVKAVALGLYHSCAILDDDSLKCWGANHKGQLGLGDTNDYGDEEYEMGDALPNVMLTPPLS